jgi:CHRD domain
MKKQFLILNLAAFAIFSLVACTKDQVAPATKDSAETELLTQGSINGDATLGGAVTLKTKSWTIPLSGLNEIPANASPMVGTGLFALYTTGPRFVLTYTLTLRKIPSGRTISAAHIHTGSSSVNGGVVWNLYSASNPAFATYETVRTDGAIIRGNRIFLTQTQYNDLLNGTNPYYINVHSNVFPGGEVRGQLQ